MSSELAAFALIVVVLWALARWLRRIRIYSDRSWLPTDLQDAELVYVERLFRVRQPLPLVARLDRGYRSPNGVITLVELKTRRVERLHLSDVIELSVQRFALEGQTMDRVADDGYVVIQQPGSQKKTAHRVRLLTHDEVIALVKRREAILADWKDAQFAGSPRLCEQCAFRQQCRPPSGLYQELSLKKYGNHGHDRLRKRTDRT